MSKLPIYQAIRTKYIGPTDLKPSRIVATCAAKRIVRSRNTELNMSDTHIAVANELRDINGWSGDLVCGCLADGSYVHVFRKTAYKKGN